MLHATFYTVVYQFCQVNLDRSQIDQHPVTNTSLTN